MIRGTLIAESLRTDRALDGVPLTVGKIARVGPLGDIGRGQPPVWTFVEFTADETRADELAASLAEAIDPVGGWYCDFRTEADTFVVFADHIFRYPRGDADGRRRAASHAEQVGVPAAQIDWPE